MSLQEQKTIEAENTSFVDAVLGGENHSPDAEEGKPDADTLPAGDDGDTPIPDDDGEGIFSDDADSTGNEEQDGGDTPPKDQSAPRETPQAPQNTELEQEIASLRKRLHDTQAAFHRATGERAALQKELDALKAKKDDDDDWFGEDDEQRERELAEKLEKSEAEVARTQAEAESLERQNAEAQWDAAAAPVIRDHPDFEEVVYNTLASLLDPEKGNPQVRAAWDGLADKSPRSVYAFAKKQLDILEFQQDPEAYKERLRKEGNTRNNGQEKPEDDADAHPVGKEGLDMLPGADMPSGGREDNVVSFVDAVFK